ncbi:hypothetical protein [uncultured Idiomarina sp.]|uniref:hypothetical protein n=1 Tax=uncultured Idiomarina sp. TaxID=352961 RepID=UPI0025964EC0|nr:hypothetical protein [uncultured Idiomarina sp.]
MTRKVSGFDEVLAKYFATMLPNAEREYFQIVKSSVDVSVWLVGLSTATIAVLLGSDSIKALLSSATLATSLIIFSLVTLFGVLQRILFHVAELKKWPLSLGLQAALTGLTDKTRVARELDEDWTVNDIVNRLREDFGVNYNFLLRHNSSIEMARDSYREQLHIHRDFEQEGIKHLAKLMCAYFGLPKEEEDGYFNTEDLDAKRKQARTVNKIFRASFYSYYISASLFVIAIITLVYGAT